MKTNKWILSMVVAGTLAVPAVPASAQLLGGAINGAAGGMLGAQHGTQGMSGAFGGQGNGNLALDPQLGNARERVGQARDRAQERTQSAKEHATSNTNAVAAGGAQASRSKDDAGDSTTAGSVLGGSVEREAAGRRVAAHGNSRHGVVKDDSGLALDGQDDAGASITKVEPASEQPATAEPADDQVK